MSSYTWCKWLGVKRCCMRATSSSSSEEEFYGMCGSVCVFVCVRCQRDYPIIAGSLHSYSFSYLYSCPHFALHITDQQQSAQAPCVQKPAASRCLCNFSYLIPILCLSYSSYSYFIPILPLPTPKNKCTSQVGSSLLDTYKTNAHHRSEAVC